MSELKLRKVSIRNWTTIRNAEITFPEKGLVLVLGKNLASGGKMDSVGSGKSSIGEAISRALVGTKGRFANTGHFSSDSNGDMYVKVETELNEQPFNVEIGYKCKEISKNSEGIRFTKGNDKPIERGKPQETRAELTEVVGVTPELAAWTVFIDGDKLKFAEQSEKESVNLLMTALRQPSWSIYHKRASTTMNDAKAKFASAKTAYDNAKYSVKTKQDALDSVAQSLATERDSIKKAEAELSEQIADTTDSITKKEASIVTLNSRLKEITKELKLLEEKSAVAYTNLQTEKATCSTKIGEHNLVKDELIRARYEIRSEQTQANNALNTMRAEPTSCPTCSKPWDKKHSADELKTQTATVQAINKRMADKVAEIDAAEKVSATLGAEYRAVEVKIAALRTPARNSELSDEHEDKSDSVTNLRREVSDLKLVLQDLKKGPDKTNLNRMMAVEEERKKALADAKSTIDESSQKMVEAEALVGVASYWYEAFGPTGIPNMVLGEAIKPLNEISKRISLLMTGGTIEVTYETARELASGDSSSELVVKVNNKLGSKRMEGSSKGEAGLTNLIVAETLSEVGSVSTRVGFRWYDEVLTNQDSTVRKSILSYLKDTANKLGILIFVVDHHADTANYCDHVLLAEKTEAGTAISWQR